MRHLLLIPMLILLAAPGAMAIEAESPGPEWKEANKKSDFIIFTKDDKEAGVRAIVAITEVDAPPSIVYQVVGDFDHYADYMPYVKESRVVEAEKNGKLLVYSLLSPPLVSDRDYYIEVKRSVGNDANGGVFKSAWTAKPDFKPDVKGVIRVRQNTGSWLLEPRDGGKRTRVTYNLLTHPGGSIPTWMANKSNTVAIPTLFEAVRERAAKTQKTATP